MMKTVMIAAAALSAMATMASAAELGATGIQLNADIIAEYDTGVELWTTTYTPELRYIAAEGLSMYVSTDVDLQDVDFAGATVGVEYYPGIKNVDLVTYVKSTSDADFNFDGAIVGAELKF